MSRRIGGATLALGIALPSLAAAQAWLPEKGEGALALTAADYAYDGHFDSDGSRDPFGGTHARSIAAEVTYGITGRLAITGSLPFITTRLSGSFPPGVPLGPLDDGRYHGDFQDFRADLRFMALAGPLALTPVLGVNVPSHRYEVIGEAVPGKRTREVFAGMNVGRALGSRAYVHARYVYSWVQKVVPDVRKLDRSNLDAEAGGSVVRRATLRGLALLQVSHGGLNLEDMRTRPGFFRDHDRAARTNYLNVGAGTTFEATHSLDIYFVFVKTVWGENAHQARSFSLGASWQFGGGWGS
ncbi:MAG: hypothetical protein DMF80_17975 [Acidobacteria bacterium]|nr:MAG: hypothetical protein DMF80_17975 [Acidobacteriota bacterium]